MFVRIRAASRDWRLDRSCSFPSSFLGAPCLSRIFQRVPRECETSSCCCLSFRGGIPDSSHDVSLIRINIRCIYLESYGPNALLCCLCEEGDVKGACLPAPGKTNCKMETFIVLGMCFLCYELCELFYQCNTLKKEDKMPLAMGAEQGKVIYTISEQPELEKLESS